MSNDPLTLFSLVTAAGFMIGLAIGLTITRREVPAAYAWNRPEVLPPVGCPLVLRLGGLAVRAERVSYLRDRAGEMDYRLSDGSVITGRFEWSYP